MLLTLLTVNKMYETCPLTFYLVSRSYIQQLKLGKSFNPSFFKFKKRFCTTFYFKVQKGKLPYIITFNPILQLSPTINPRKK